MMSTSILVSNNPSAPGSDSTSSSSVGGQGVGLILAILVFGAGLIYLKYLVHTGKALWKDREWIVNFWFCSDVGPFFVGWGIFSLRRTGVRLGVNASFIGFYICRKLGHLPKEDRSEQDGTPTKLLRSCRVNPKSELLRPPFGSRLAVARPLGSLASERATPEASPGTHRTAPQLLWDPEVLALIGPRSVRFLSEARPLPFWFKERPPGASPGYNGPHSVRYAYAYLGLTSLYHEQGRRSEQVRALIGPYPPVHFVHLPTPLFV